MKKFCYVATVPIAVNAFLKDIIQCNAKENKIKVIASPEGSEVLSSLDAEFLALSIARKPSILRDLVSFWRLIKIFRHEKFDVIHSIMPKSGFFSMLAGFITHTPIRIHTFTGQVWRNKQGLQRWLLKLCDKLLVLCATHVLVDSPSQRDFLIKEGILKKNQAKVIGKGSICGVDTEEFKFTADTRLSIRQSLNKDDLTIDDDSIILIFMARLTKQKGVLELAEAFSRVANVRANVFLFVIGQEENVTFNEIVNISGIHKNKLFRLAYTLKPSDYLSACDILCLPSAMEGFGQVIVNASACGLPVVASKIYGITDAVKENETGILYPLHDIDALTEALLKLIDDKKLRLKMGQAGREYVVKNFDKKFITQELMTFYNQLSVNNK